MNSNRYSKTVHLISEHFLTEGIPPEILFTDSVIDFIAEHMIEPFEHIDPLEISVIIHNIATDITEGVVR